MSHGKNNFFGALANAWISSSLPVQTKENSLGPLGKSAIGPMEVKRSYAILLGGISEVTLVTSAVWL